MKAKIQNNSLPPGAYAVEFDGIEEINSEAYGPGWRWKFVVVSGRLRDRECSRITGDKPTMKNAAGRFLAALAGVMPRDDLEVDTDAYLGQRYTAMVQPTADGTSTRVESIARAASDADETTVPPTVTVTVLPPSAAGADIPF